MASKTTTRPAPRAFKSQAEWRAWLNRNHRKATEIIVRCAKAHAAHQGVTYSEALDEALCFGWIDGVRRRLDADSFSIRFTPRKPRSIWSRVNVAHVERLIRAGRMTEQGMAAFDAREDDRTGVYSFEQSQTKMAPAFTRTFRAAPEAWAYFRRQAPWYQRTSTHWVMSAKREATREKRLGILMACSAQCKPIPQLDRNG